MVETRIKIEASEVETKYYAQYKVKFLLFNWWEFFDPLTSTGDHGKATHSAWKRGEIPFTKEWAEFVCEEYHRIKSAKLEKKLKQEKHSKTKNVTYYKHP